MLENLRPGFERYESLIFCAILPIGQIELAPRLKQCRRKVGRRSGTSQIN